MNKKVISKIFGIALVCLVVGATVGGLLARTLPFVGFSNQSQALAQGSKTWYVDDDGADYPDADFTKIQDAVDAASTGDTIFVYNGTYPEHISISKNNLTVIGEDKDNTIIDGGYSEDAVISVNADFVKIISFTVKSHEKDVWESHTGILLSHSNNCELENNSCLNNCIWLEESSNNILSKNTASLDYCGIGLFSSNNNTVDSNNVSHHGDYGIILESSSCNNTISNNFATDSCWGIGVRHYNTNNKIVGNTVTDNAYGIAFWSSSVSNVVARNNISNNWFGLWFSSYNNIYLNNFVENVENVYSQVLPNTWNSLEEITYTYNGNSYTNYLGNYWSDYTWSDADGDGIGDTPYSIDSDEDNYPLMVPFENYEIVGAVLPGDANGDGVVNSLDITKVERIIVGLDTETPGADANQDGVVNNLDITKVERIIVGLD